MSISREFDSYSQPIRFVRLNSEHAQTSRFLLLALGARPVGTRMSFTHMLTVAHALWITLCRGFVFVLSLVFVLPPRIQLMSYHFCQDNSGYGEWPREDLEPGNRFSIHRCVRFLDQDSFQQQRSRWILLGEMLGAAILVVFVCVVQLDYNFFVKV